MDCKYGKKLTILNNSDKDKKSVNYLFLVPAHPFGC